MIQAMARMNDGRLLLVLGLSEGNVERLKAGRPIHVDPQVLLRVKPDGVIGGIAILYGETEAAITKLFVDEGLIADGTEVRAVPRAPNTKQ